MFDCCYVFDSVMFELIFQGQYILLRLVHNIIWNSVDIGSRS